MVRKAKSGRTPVGTSKKTATCQTCGREEKGNLSKDHLEKCSRCVQGMVPEITKKSRKVARKEAKKRAVERKATKKAKREAPKKSSAELPDKLYKHHELGPLLKEYQDGGNTARLRRDLRALGFKLSDPTTWEKFL